MCSSQFIEFLANGIFQMRFFILCELSNIIGKNFTLLNQNIEYFFIMVRHEGMKACQISKYSIL